jgi:hypothetical protein
MSPVSALAEVDYAGFRPACHVASPLLCVEPVALLLAHSLVLRTPGLRGVCAVVRYTPRGIPRNPVHPSWVQPLAIPFINFRFTSQSYRE